MKAIERGDTGAAVEDIQRRLSVLGYDLGAGGIDSVFRDDTRAAVEAFQRASGIQSTGVVGPRTWSALVDSTFELGDRMLYLRMPHFHGADVTALQNALNSLGFTIGPADGIFGSYTERAIAEFQENCHLNPDGIAGTDTFRALFALRHIWDGKAGWHSSARGGPRQPLLTLLTTHFVFETEGEAGNGSLQRLARLANEIEQAARDDMTWKNKGSASTPATTIRVLLSINDNASNDMFVLIPKNPLSVGACLSAEILESKGKPSLSLGLQHVASMLLDALCLMVSETSEASGASDNENVSDAKK